MRILMSYTWPGNIRELQNVIERSVLMSDGGVLLPVHLPPDIVALANGPDGPQAAISPSTLLGQERALIVRSLEQHNWNQSQAARALGITRDHLRHRIRKYGLHRPVLEDQTLGSASEPAGAGGDVIYNSLYDSGLQKADAI
jgi:transcriptional regulator of acetoin/glycerol metabolism